MKYVLSDTLNIRLFDKIIRNTKIAIIKIPCFTVSVPIFTIYSSVCKQIQFVINNFHGSNNFLFCTNFVGELHEKEENKTQNQERTSSCCTWWSTHLLRQIFCYIQERLKNIECSANVIKFVYKLTLAQPDLPPKALRAPCFIICNETKRRKIEIAAKWLWLRILHNCAMINLAVIIHDISQCLLNFKSH